MESSARLAGESADQALVSLSKIPNLTKEWRSKIAIGLTLFNPSSTPVCSFNYIVENEPAAELVYEWWPTGVLATCLRIITKPDQLEFTSMDFDTFRKAVELIVESSYQIHFVAYAIAVDFPEFGAQCSGFGLRVAFGLGSSFLGACGRYFGA